MNGPQDAYAAYERARELHERAQELHARGGQPARAEALYRKAIAGGFSDAHYNLGLLLRDLGRAGEAERALRAAVSSANPEVASRAAIALARWLELQRPERAAARSFYKVALDRGTGAVYENAALGLALLLAEAGDRKTATPLIHDVVKRRYRRAGDKDVTDDSGLRFAEALSSILAWPPANTFVRHLRHGCSRAGLLRRRRQLVGFRRAVGLSLRR
jgi:tetratricopeptide (TPR) repeat protein